LSKLSVVQDIRNYLHALAGIMTENRGISQVCIRIRDCAPQIDLQRVLHSIHYAEPDVTSKKAGLLALNPMPVGMEYREPLPA